MDFLTNGLSPSTRTWILAEVFVSSWFMSVPRSFPMSRSMSSCQKWRGSPFIRIQNRICEGKVAEMTGSHRWSMTIQYAKCCHLRGRAGIRAQILCS
ncbi:unnamed protein product [Brassica oleracea]